MRESYFENEYAETWIEDGIVFQVYKRDLIINIDIAKKLFQDRLTVSNCVTRPVFVDVGNLVSIDRASMKYYMSKEVFQYISAAAFLLDNYIARLAMNVFLNIGRPLVPAKFFTSREEALKWLSIFKHMN